MKLRKRLILMAIVMMTLILITTSILTASVLAVKEGSSSISSVKTSSKSGFVHIRGVKVLRVHTVPSKVTAGSTFGLRAIVVNNSTAAIAFANGTCPSPLSLTFDKNAISEPQTRTTICKTQQVTLKPGERSPILISKLSGTIFRATSPGTTNATLVFKYGVVSPTSKTPFSDSISRVYTFNILQSGTTSTSTSTTTHSHSPHITRSATSSQPGILKFSP